MIEQSLRHSLCFALCLSLFACGPKGSAKDPLPLAPKPGTTTGYPEGTPTKLPSDTPTTPELVETGTTTPVTPTTPSITITPDTSIPTTLAPPGGDVNAQIAAFPAIGTADTIEIGTWNIENYPKTSESKNMVSKVLNRLDVDIMAVEEVSNTQAFTELLAEMPKFSGVIAGQNGGQKSQNVGLIFRTAEFKVVASEDLFRGEGEAFPRPPLMVRLDPVKEGQNDIVAIVVHLKAFGDEDSVQRREQANVKLEAYASALLAKEPSLQVILLGDFNQPLLTNAEREVFRPWYDRPETYSIKTESLVTKKDYTFFGGQRFSVIAHIITSNNFTMNEPMVPKLQTAISSFETHASDHLPVVATIAP